MKPDLQLAFRFAAATLLAEPLTSQACICMCQPDGLSTAAVQDLYPVSVRLVT